ncbi:MAG: phosphotransferase [Alphaproteobacteria bacterium]|nr:phosphotransferase [Alphaproteobacteria bacterium]
MNAEAGAFRFLQAAGWEKAKAFPLKADFSSRQFARLEREDGEPRRAILMQAAPEQKTPQFIAIADLLRRCGLSAPEVYAGTASSLPLDGKEQPCSGVEFDLVLMEDFGDVTFGKLMDNGAAQMPLYRRASDVLAHLHKTFDLAWVEGLDLPSFNAAMFTAQAELFLDFYYPYACKRATSTDEREAFRAAWLDVLAPLDALPRSLMLRDYMPDNLMDLEKKGEETPSPAKTNGLLRKPKFSLPLPQGERDIDYRSVGLLDFQDGGIGPIAYDIASLCECVRRSADLGLLNEVIDYYHAQNPVMPLSDLRRTCRVLSAQRHTRVLGIVVRLAQSQGRNTMPALLPRVKSYLDTLLRDDALAPVHTWTKTHLK